MHLQDRIAFGKFTNAQSETILLDHTLAAHLSAWSRHFTGQKEQICVGLLLQTLIHSKSANFTFFFLSSCTHSIRAEGMHERRIAHE